jgi:uncharacterized protein (DUF58 family)
MYEHLPPQLWRTIQQRQFRQKILIKSQGEGTHRTRQKGFGSEFSEYRAYEPGDNPKHIDWNHFAKTDKLYTKVFLEEKNLSILLFIDGSNSMRFSSKWGYARTLTLALGAIGVKNSETISVCITPALPLLNMNSLGSLNRINQTFQILPSTEAMTLSSSVLATLQRAKLPSLAVIISDFLDEPAVFSEILDVLRLKNIEITGIQILDDVDFNPLGGLDFAKVVDSESGIEATIYLPKDSKLKYAESLKRHCRAIETLFFNRRANFISITTEKDLTLVLNRTLKEGGLLL